MTTHVWWFITRSSGIVASLLLTGSVAWGLLLSTRIFGRAVAAPGLLAVHRYLGALAVAFTAMHMAALAADRYVNFGMRELFVPMASPWKPAAVAYGIIAFYVLIAVEVTSLLRRRLPRRVWRAIHMTSFFAFVAVIKHVVSAGTDAKSAAMMWGAIIIVWGLVFLAIVRILTARWLLRAERIAGPVTGTTA